TARFAVLVRHLCGSQDDAGQGAEGDGTADALHRISAGRALGEVADAQDGAAILNAEVHQRLQGAAGLRVLVAVASNGAHHRINYQQADAAGFSGGDAEASMSRAGSKARCPSWAMTLPTK